MFALKIQNVMNELGNLAVLTVLSFLVTWFFFESFLYAIARIH